jgi:hypothetical protein
MAITREDKQELKQFYEAHRERFGGQMPDYFALQYLVRKFHCQAGDVGNQVAFGGKNDFGLDAFSFLNDKAATFIFTNSNGPKITTCSRDRWTG